MSETQSCGDSQPTEPMEPGDINQEDLTTTLKKSGGTNEKILSAHILNLIVQDGLAEIRNLLDDIRQSVRYLDRTPSAMQKFERAKHQCKLQNRKAVASDVPTRWNSTFDILAIPATTVASESAFSLCGRIIDETRSKLSPSVVEALVVATDWIPPLKEKVHQNARNEVLGTISEGDKSEV